MHAVQPIPLAQLRGVVKRFGAVTALERVDLELHAGQVLALLGANGAGKSTAISLLLGLLEPDEGEALLLGSSPRTLAARQQAGVMLQSGAIADTLRVGELLDLTRSYYPKPRSMEECTAIAGLEGMLERRYGRLSGGQQRRAQLALAICGRPRVLFLDEPTTGLDIEVRQSLWRGVRELAAGGTSILLTTHYLEEAEVLADRVVVLAHGRVVVDGSLEEVRARVSQRRIRCASALDPAEVARWPGVRSATRQDGRLEVVTDDAEDVARRLLARDPGLTGLDVSRAGLAEAFLEITREQPSQEAA